MIEAVEVIFEAGFVGDKTLGEPLVAIGQSTVYYFHVFYVYSLILQCERGLMMVGKFQSNNSSAFSIKPVHSANKYRVGTYGRARTDELFRQRL